MGSETKQRQKCRRSEHAIGCHTCERSILVPEYSDKNDLNSMVARVVAISKN
jgi:hypothetical protein